MDEVVYAGFWRRAAALLVDLAIVATGLWAMGLAIGVGSPGWIVHWEWKGGEASGERTWSYGAATDFDPLATALTCAYFLVPEALAWRATPGKRMLGLAVTGGDGRLVSADRALARVILKPVSILTLGLGFALAGVTRRKQALHDLLADCAVVRVAPRG